MIGILTWNQKVDTLRCLEALEKVAEPELKIFVVDNGSGDGSVQAIEERFPNVEVYTSAVNLGCAGGRTVILRRFLQSKADYLAFLDNDAFVEPDCFVQLLEEIERAPEIGVVGIKAYYLDEPNKFWSRGGAQFDPWRCCFTKLGQRETDDGQYNKSEDVDSIPGGFTFLKRQVADKVPVMDERYFIYYEDSDWCFRVKRAGLRLVTSAKAKVVHKASSSLGMASALFYYYRTRNRLLFAKTYMAWYQFLFFCGYFFVWQLPQTVYMLLREGRLLQVKAISLGVLDYTTGKWGQCSHSCLEPQPG